jgi:hypothetical protein
MFDPTVVAQYGPVDMTIAPYDSVVPETGFRQLNRTTIAVQHALGNLTYTYWIWTVATVQGAPVLSAPRDMNATIAGYLGIAATSVNCFDSTPIELGTRTGPDGTVYGQGTELAIACFVPKPTGTGNSAQVFAEFDAPDPTQPPIFELLLDTGIDSGLSFRQGDVNGDGLQDLIYSGGAAGETLVHVHLQCRVHDTSCS